MPTNKKTTKKTAIIVEDTIDVVEEILDAEEETFEEVVVETPSVEVETPKPAKTKNRRKVARRTGRRG